MQANLRLGLTDCTGLVIVNVRINRNKEIDDSRPCPGCLSLLNYLNYSQIYHTNKSGEFEEYNF
jgi:hypothetical protein